MQDDGTTSISARHVISITESDFIFCLDSMVTSKITLNAWTFVFIQKTRGHVARADFDVTLKPSTCSVVFVHSNKPSKAIGEFSRIFSSKIVFNVLMTFPQMNLSIMTVWLRLWPRLIFERKIECLLSTWNASMCRNPELCTDRICLHKLGTAFFTTGGLASFLLHVLAQYSLSCHALVSTYVLSQLTLLWYTVSYNSVVPEHQVPK